MEKLNSNWLIKHLVKITSIWELKPVRGYFFSFINKVALFLHLHFFSFSFHHTCLPQGTEMILCWSLSFLLLWYILDVWEILWQWHLVQHILGNLTPVSRVFWHLSEFRHWRLWPSLLPGLIATVSAGKAKKSQYQSELWQKYLKSFLLAGKSELEQMKLPKH